MITNGCKPWKTFFYSEDETDWFFDGSWKEWVEESKGKVFQNSDIKKIEDASIRRKERKRNSGAEKKKKTRTHYFSEWKAAFELYRQYGFCSVLSPYHPDCPDQNKVEIVKGKVSQVWDLAIATPVKNKNEENEDIRAGLPDLFVYHPDNENEWFFVEVKKEDDIKQVQEKKSRQLDDAAGKCVSYLIQLEKT